MQGKRLSDRYEILSELGRGGMGVVYRAKDPLLNREVAVKVIFASHLTPETEKRFQAEAQLIAGMDHPNIVSIYDFGRHEGGLFFVMPVLEGESLRQFLRDHGSSLRDVVDIGIAIGKALEYSHEKGVIHRDIKPENVMISRESDRRLRVRVMDFGVARRNDMARVTRTGHLIGTMHYMSPEQIMGEAGDERSDIYALGIVLFECLTNRVPFSGEAQALHYRILNEDPAPLSTFGVNVDDEIEVLIQSCLAKTPSDRPAKAKDIVAQLEAYRSRLKEDVSNESMSTTRGSKASLPPSSSPFIGRAEELRELQRRLNIALKGACQFVVVSGEMGVGKSRLLDELETVAKMRGIRVLQGRFVEHDGAFPYHGFCEAFQDYFRQKELSQDDKTLPDISDLGSDLIELFPMLSDVEAVRQSTSTTSSLSSKVSRHSPEHKTQVYELLARTFIRLSEGEPLVLRLEDLDHAIASLDALQYIVRRLSTTSVLILGTFREPVVDKKGALRRMLDGFQGDPRFCALRLLPFSRDELQVYVSHLVNKEVSPGLLEELFEETEGNPFFVKELTGSLLASGGIQPDPTGVWGLTGGVTISSGGLPATLQQAVEKRIARLPDHDRELLAVASVMGRTFEYRNLEELTEAGSDLDDAVDRLLQEGLIEEREARGDQLSMASGVLREVLYRELSRRRRRTLHRRYGTLLEKRFAGRLERVAQKLLYHFSEGDVPDKTVTYGLLTAKKSLDSFSPEEAIRCARIALEFIDAEWEGDATAEGEARMLLSEGQRMTGDVDGALREANIAARVFERTGCAKKEVAALLFGARTAWQARRTEETRSWVERGVEAARSAGEKESLRQFLSLAATLANLRGESWRANEHLKESEELGADTEVVAKLSEVPQGGNLRIGLGNPVLPGALSSIYLREEREVLSSIYETLLDSGEFGNPVPALCEKWEVRESGRCFYFWLRPGVTFSDGRKLVSEDVKNSFERGIKECGFPLIPPFRPILGANEFLQGKTEEVAGLVLHGKQEFEIRLTEPLPIYPAVLTDVRAGVGRPSESGTGASVLLGTGPYCILSHGERKVVLQKVPEYWRGPPARLDQLEFHHGLSASQLAEMLRSGEIDLAGNILPQDLEEILRDPRFRKSFVEVPGSFTYFILFNTCSGQFTRSPRVREALASVLRVRDLVWQTLGRFAQPALGMIPPSILGHDPGRRPRQALSVREAREILTEEGIPESVNLRVLVQPIIQDSYGDLLSAMAATWKELGVSLSIDSPDMARFPDALFNHQGLDMAVIRWHPDFNDPDDCTHTLFHGKTGRFRSYFSSPEGDEILEAARAELRPSLREGKYRRFENLLETASAIVPLFHDVDYRVVSPKVRRLELGSNPPYVNYRQLGKSEAEAADPVERSGGVLRVPITGRVRSLDPAMTATTQQAEVLPCLFETLTRDVGEATVVPWLCEEFSVENGGKRYRFRLRKDVLFHDGRRLTARDVRYTFERLLRKGWSGNRWLCSPVLGAKEVLRGEAPHLSGFHIESAIRFSIELERPVSFFPGLLSAPGLSIVPEGSEKFTGSWRDGLVGTGPFRVARFEPGRRLSLESHPSYWRDGYPRSRGLFFDFGVSPEEILKGFRAGRYSLASDLFPEDVSSLRRETGTDMDYRETPSFSTCFLLFNLQRGSLRDRSTREALVHSVEVDRLVASRLGQLAVPARALIAPGLLGDLPPEAPVHSPEDRPTEERKTDQVKLTVAADPIYFREYSGIFESILDSFERGGFLVSLVNATMVEFQEALDGGRVDVVFARRVADFPDAHSFVQTLHSVEGRYGHLLGAAEIDALIEKGRTESDPQTRQLVYREIEELLRKNAWILPLFHEQVYRFAGSDVEGLNVSYWSPTVAYENLRLRRG